MRYQFRLTVLASLLALSCVTTGGSDGRTIEWERVEIELHLAAADLDDVASILEPSETRDAIVQLSGLLLDAELAVDGRDREGGGDPLVAVGVALDLAERLADDLSSDNDQQNVRAAVLIVRAALRRCVAYQSLVIEVEPATTEVETDPLPEVESDGATEVQP